MAMSRRPYRPRAATARRPRAPVEATVLEYTRTSGKGLSYTIEADGFGSYRILLGDKLLRTGVDMLVQAKIGSDWRYPTAKRLETAIARAKADIEGLVGMAEK